LLKAWAPIMLLGVPLAESENPFLAIPGYRGRARVDVWECDSPKLESGSSRVKDLLEDFVSRFSQQAGEPICVRLDYEIEGSVSPASEYAFATTLIVYAAARSFGESLDSWEVVEAARYADPLEYPSGWAYTMDALRYAVATGKVVVYRNDEEFAAMSDPVDHGLAYAETVKAAGQVLTREAIGPDPYNALVHLVGVSVLEAAVRLREGGSVDSLAGLRSLLTSIISAAWALDPPRDGCALAPGFPGGFDVYCRG